MSVFPQEGSENDEEEREEEEEENTDYLTDSNKENETDEENNVSEHTGRTQKQSHCLNQHSISYWMRM